MPVRNEIFHHNGVYFITFTCNGWLPLFELADGYQLVYDWFDKLLKDGNHIIGYVIMPNHIHAIIAFKEHIQSVNTRIGTGKRFMAYGLVNLLKERQQLNILHTLSATVNKTDQGRGKLHHVFKASFDCKECRTEKFLLQKLNYIHANPCRGKWHLADSPENYKHSSAKYYMQEAKGYYSSITHYKFIETDLARPVNEKGN